jgi:hypothetical protein
LLYKYINIYDYKLIFHKNINIIISVFLYKYIKNKNKNNYNIIHYKVFY